MGLSLSTAYLLHQVKGYRLCVKIFIRLSNTTVINKRKLYLAYYCKLEGKKYVTHRLTHWKETG